MSFLVAILSRARFTVGDGLLSVEAIATSNVSDLRVQRSGISRFSHLRSLLSGETLEQNTGVLVDLEVVHGAVVGRGGLSPTLGGADIAKGREGVTAEGLHSCECARGER